MRAGILTVLTCVCVCLRERHFMAGFSLDFNRLFSHCEIEKQVPNSKHQRILLFTSASVFQLGNITRMSFLLLPYENR